MSKGFHHIEGSINSISYSCQMIISLIMGRPKTYRKSENHIFQGDQPAYHWQADQIFYRVYITKKIFKAVFFDPGLSQNLEN